ncbi:molybdate ABC transporter substrate-binding protein [Williamsia sp.]|uniref:molybdate ABC transporter substrate-binding protein n=1 Tax=Williamsia sp. TaxID=1872085 RepID=UPI002F923F38
MKSKIFAIFAPLLSTALLLAGCSSNDDDSSAGGTSSAGTEKVTLTVFAAASLKNSFTALAEEFSEDNPNIEVKYSFDGSSALVTQIQQGAPADVIATADEKNMAKLGDSVSDPQIFATNVLTIVTQPGNPKNIQSLADLTRSDVSTVVCAVDVPCGNATAQVEQNTGIDIKPVSEETAVTGVLTKVQTKQADAGLVYVTDATGAGATVTAVSDPAFAAVVNKYPIGVVAATKYEDAAQKFVDMILGPQGAALLASKGFGPSA